MDRIDPAVVEHVRQAAASDRYAAYLRNTLLDLVAINTAPDGDLAATASREKQFWDWVAREIRDVTGGTAVVEHVPMRTGIGADPAYSPPGYAAGADGTIPAAELVYRDRGNLAVFVPGADGDRRPAAILHAHVDVVSPWFAPRSAGERVFGRGACDNKAQVAVLLAQLKLLREIGEQLGQRPARGYVIHFTLDEEIGGNGSLSMAADERFAGLPVLMLESTDLVPYCAHRGCVYYRCRLSVGDHPDVTAAEMFPLVVHEFEAEGRRIKEETDYPLFSAVHVQTNHGVLGPYGEHPGSVCDHVAVEIVAQTKANPERVGLKMIELMEEALAEYCRLYGDKRRELDPATGQPKVARHFDVKVMPMPQTQNFRLDVWGKSGHMAAVAQCDNAITKAAYLLGVLLRIAPTFPGVRAYGRFADSAGDDREVVLEGGQGFTPTHRMADVQERLRAAARRGVEQYCRLRRLPFAESMVELSFDRLHNDAYADSPDSVPMQALKVAFEAVGEPWPALTGWATSCDARLYHHHGHPVAIFGAGKLDAAHSENEYVDIPEVQKTLATATLATWALTG